MASPAAVAALRKAQEGVRRLVERDLAAFWAKLDMAEPEAVRDALIEHVPKLVNTYGEVAATYAADWYDGVRASAGAKGAFKARMVVPDNSAAIEQTIRRQVGGLFGETPDPEGVLSSLSSRVGRYALEGSRQTIAQASRGDPAAKGWNRVALPTACPFCASLALHFDYEADFEAHDGCNCIAVPDF